MASIERASSPVNVIVTQPIAPELESVEKLKEQFKQFIKNQLPLKRSRFDNDLNLQASLTDFPKKELDLIESTCKRQGITPTFF